MTDREENPIASGLIALVAVAVVVGLLGGIAALAGTRMLGLADGGSVGSGDPVAGETLSMPPPVPTEPDSGPLLTLAPTDGDTGTDLPSDFATEPTDRPTKEEPSISLTAGTTMVQSGEELRLSGLYRRGEGAVLDILYNVNGAGWEEFPLDVNVTGGIFEVYVQTWKQGTIKWRVRDASTGRVSDTVTVRHG